MYLGSLHPWQSYNTHQTHHTLHNYTGEHSDNSNFNSCNLLKTENGKILKTLKIPVTIKISEFDAQHKTCSVLATLAI